MTSAATRTGTRDLGPENRWRVLGVLAAALVIVAIDVTVLHVAAPAIAQDLRPSSTELLWIIDVYPLVVAPLLLASSSLGDRFGRKRALLAGLVLFTAASAFAAFAWSPGALIAARALQGVGGALIMPSTMSLLRAVFPDRAERVRAVGIWSAVLAAGAAAGPLLGGFLVEHLSWHAVFLINVPVLLAVLPFALRILPESRHSAPPPWDMASIALAGSGVLLLAYGIKHGARHGFDDAQAIAALAVSAAALIAFVRRQLRAAQPMLDVRLFQRPAFAVAVGAVALSMFALIGLELFFAQYLQLVLGLGPLEASVRLLPLMLATLAGSFCAARVLARFGSRRTLAIGFGVTALATLPLLALGTADAYLLFALPMIPMGLALEIALVAANDAILSSVSADGAGQAASIEETAYDLGGGIGVAVLGAIGAAVYSASVAGAPGVPAEAGGSITDAVAVANDLPAAAGGALLAAARDAWLSGFHVVLVVSFVVTAAGALLTWRFTPHERTEPAAARAYAAG